jgi:hypothetical protein
LETLFNVFRVGNINNEQNMFTTGKILLNVKDAIAELLQLPMFCLPPLSTNILLLPHVFKTKTSTAIFCKQPDIWMLCKNNFNSVGCLCLFLSRRQPI